MHQAIQNRVGHGIIGDHVVPLADGKLTGDQSRAEAIAIVQDFQEVSVLFWADGGEAQIIHDQQSGFLNVLEQLGEAALGVSPLQSPED